MPGPTPPGAELPEPPEGKVLVVDDATFIGIDRTGEEEQMVFDVHEYHFEDEEEFEE